MKKINRTKTPLFPILNCFDPSFEDLDTQLKHLETQLEPWSSKLSNIEDRGLRDCELNFCTALVQAYLYQVLLFITFIPLWVVSSCTGTQRKETLTNCVITPCMVMKTKGIPSCTGTPGQPPLWKRLPLSAMKCQVQWLHPSTKETWAFRIELNHHTRESIRAWRKQRSGRQWTSSSPGRNFDHLLHVAIIGVYQSPIVPIIQFCIAFSCVLWKERYKHT